MQIKILQNFIDILRGKKDSKIFLKFYLPFFQKRLEYKIKKLRKKVKAGKKIKTAFIYMYIQEQQNITIFDKMLESDIFDPYFIVYPDISRGGGA